MINVHLHNIFLSKLKIHDTLIKFHNNLFGIAKLVIETHP